MSEDVKNKNNQKKSFLQSCFNSHVIFLSRSSESKLMTTKIKLLKSLRIRPGLAILLEANLKESAKGNYLSLGVVVRATSQDQLDDLYKALVDHEYTKFVL